MKQPIPAILFPVLWPLGTTAPSARPPWATLLLLGLNLVMLGILAVAPAALHERLAFGASPHLYQYLTCAIVPACLITGVIDMIFLWAFAPTLEHRLGPWKLALLYAATGAVGAMAHEGFQGPGQERLAGGAAAVLGLAGALIVIYPREAVRVFAGITLLHKPLFAREWRVPILLFALIYAGLQYLFHWLDAHGHFPLLNRAVFSPGALLGGLAGGAILSGILHRAPVTAKSPAMDPRLATEGRPEGRTTNMELPATPPEEAPTPLVTAAAVAASAEMDLPAHAARNESLGDIYALFGNPEDSALIATMPRLDAPPPKPRVSERPPEETIMPIRLLDETGDTPDGAPPPEAPAAAICDEEKGMQHEAKSEDEKRDDMKREEPAQPPATLRNTTSMAQNEEKKHTRTDEEEAIRLSIEPSEETVAQARALRDETAWPDVHAGRFSVILAPGRPSRIDSIVTLLAEMMNLSLKGAYQVLRHRHGILVDNVTREEAERVAARFKEAGHPVLIVALTGRLDFGGGMDLISIQEHGSHVLFTTVAQMIPAEWSQIVFLAGGRVRITPGTPPRVVLDIFLIKPRHHLRLWDNTFSYSREMPKFRTQVLRITERATEAIHTRSLDKWLRDESEALHPFDSMIEYEHYVRWHLMAHLLPTKEVK